MMQLAALFAGVLLVIFFLLAVRTYLDARAGKPVAPLKPTRSPAALLRSMAREK